MAAGIEGIQPVTSDLRSVYGGRFRAPALPQSIASASDQSAQVSDSSSAARAAETLRQNGEQPVADLSQVVDDTNNSLASANRSVRFKINEDTNRVQIQIVDSERQRVIRSIPSDEMLQLASRMREFSGIGVLVDQSR